MRSIISVIVFMALFTVRSHAQGEDAVANATRLITCSNKIALRYYNKTTEQMESGCFNSTQEVINDPNKLLFDYEIPAANYEYFPLKINLPDYELDEVWAKQLAICSTFDRDVARACLLNAVNQWNSVCNDPQKELEIVPLSDAAHTIIEFTNREQDIDGNPEKVNANTFQYPAQYPPGVTPPDDIARYKNEKSHVPKLYLNLTDKYTKDHVWSTDCPCDEVCTEKKKNCVSFCRILMHELGHLYGPMEADYCFSPSDPFYDENSIMYSQSKYCNSNHPDIQETCDLSLRNMDICVFCKVVCPAKCSGIVTSIESETIVEPTSFSIDAFPNPSKGELILRISNPSKHSLYCSIYDIRGVKIFEFDWIDQVNGEIKIDLMRHLRSKGLYFITFYSEVDYAVKKVLYE